MAEDARSPDSGGSDAADLDAANRSTPDEPARTADEGRDIAAGPDEENAETGETASNDTAANADAPRSVVVKDQLQQLGEFIRTQRKQSQMSLRDLSERTNVSNPYLSQIERGLHEPSVRVLRSIAVALNLSVETMLVRAGLLTEDDEAMGPTDTETAILNDPRLTEDQRSSLLAVYRTYTS